MLSRAEAGLRGMRARTSRRLWSWQELRILDRFARALAAGEYRSARASAVACQQELDVQRGRHPYAGWAVSQRTVVGIRAQIVERARALGAVWPGTRLLGEERRIVERYAGAFLRGEYPDVRAAARACREELERTEFGGSGGIRYRVRRPYFGVYGSVLELVRKSGWTEPDGHWSAREKQVAARYARDLVHGRYATAAEATRACRRYFDLLRRRRPAPKWLAPRRKDLGVWVAVTRAAHSMGWAGRPEFWSAEATALADLLVRRVLTGACPTLHQAALEFLREARKRRGRCGFHTGRSYRSVMWKLGERARLLGKEPEHVAWTPAEDRMLDRHIKAMAAGRFETADQAARAFVDDPRRKQREQGRQRPYRTLDSALHRLRKRTDLRGTKSKRRVSAEERRIAEKWVRSYVRHRRDGDFWALGDAAGGLRRELSRHGFDRTHSACVHLVLFNRPVS